MWFRSESWLHSVATFGNVVLQIVFLDGKSRELCVAVPRLSLSHVRILPKVSCDLPSGAAFACVLCSQTLKMRRLEGSRPNGHRHARKKDVLARALDSFHLCQALHWSEYRH